jgi:hypothetical protein
MTADLPPRPEELEPQLAELTTWPEDPPALWSKALQGTKQSVQIPWLRRIAALPLPRPALAAVVLLCVGVLVVAFTLPGLDSARRPTHLQGQIMTGADWRSDADRATPASAAPPKPAIQYHGTLPEEEIALPEALLHNSGGGGGPSPARQDVDRLVARKATIELTTPDVRGTFAKAAHLISEAGGEYVEGSSLSGEGPNTQGTLTLRVAAARLGAVMTSLRELGAVKNENTTGEDVTAQAVDLESRIRNEQRVEQELLQLLEKRNDAPLKDILELRGSLASVRESIERLTGQREKLGRLVSLASVLVVIRTADAPPPPPRKSGIGEYFSGAVASSWRSGLEFLSNTVAAAIALVIGGLVWWVLLAALALGAFRWHRRLAARCV